MGALKIRYYCHAGQNTGYGRAATELALALVAAGVDLSVVPINPDLSHFLEGDEAAALRSRVCNGDDFDFAIIHTMPLDCRAVYEHEVKWSRDLAYKPVVAYTTWEGVDVPAHVVKSLRESFDDVWVPSNATYDAFLSTLPSERSLSTFILPHTYDVEKWRAWHAYQRETGHKYKDEVPFRFCYIGAWNARKNPHGLIRAFSRAFTPDDHVELVVHSPGVSVEMFTAALVATGLEQSEQPSIRLSGRYRSDGAMQAMHGGYDCFVTATRGEAWNLPAFEAMLAGRMVIAPGGMGHDDFLFDDPDVLPFGGERLTDAVRVPSVHQPAFVDVELVDRVTVGGLETESRRPGLQFRTVGAQGLSSRTTWRDPDLVSLAMMMRAVYEQRSRAINLNYSPDQRFGYAAVAMKAIDRLTHLLDQSRHTRHDERDYR
jgi:glycosyltransferase involved in cell wall biosynthesis